MPRDPEGENTENLPSRQRRHSIPALFSALLGLTTLAILAQAVIAGRFVNQKHHDSWVTVHGAVGDATWALALLTAIVATVTLRRVHRRLWLGSTALFVLALAQAGLGHLISDQGKNGLIVVHVPLAMVIFGLAIWLSATAARARREAPLDPYARRPGPAGLGDASPQPDPAQGALR